MRHASGAGHRRLATATHDLEVEMIRAIVTLLILGFVGMAVLGLLFGLLVPLLAVALKVGLVLLIGYLVLRVVSPRDAEKVRDKLRREK